MKIKAEYKGKTVEIDIPDEKLEELVKEQKKTGWERLNDSDTFYLIDEEYRVKSYGFLNGGRSSERCYHVGNCFNSLQLAENIARYQSLDLRIRRRIAEICDPVNWSDGNSCKSCIYYDHSYKHLYISSWYGNQFSGWYCDTNAHAEQIINEFREELMWYFTEFKDRMDAILDVECVDED